MKETVKRNRPERQARLSFYERGETSMFACRFDQRFSYCMYVPGRYEESDAEYPLVIPVHGGGRGAQRYRKEFAEFAELHQCIVLAPLFPCGIIEPRETDNYKFIVPGVGHEGCHPALIGRVKEFFSRVIYTGGNCGER
jgi:poly(3-hydroxybutyrate) depolymerase